MLRFDDRGCGQSTGNNETAAIEDFAGDAKAGFDLLQTFSFVNRDQIGFIGHSEGGIIAEYVAGEFAETAYIVLMAAGIMPVIDIFKYQNQTAAIRGADISLKKYMDQGADIIFTESDKGKIKEKLAALFQGSPVPAEWKDSLVKFLEDFAGSIYLKVDSAEYIAKTKCPILALGGDKDIAVPAKENHKALDAMMAKMKRTNYQTIEFPNVNHFFQTCKFGMPGESPALEETMSPKVMQAISDWILREMKKTPSK